MRGGAGFMFSWRNNCEQLADKEEGIATETCRDVSLDHPKEATRAQIELSRLVVFVAGDYCFRLLRRRIP